MKKDNLQKNSQNLNSFYKAANNGNKIKVSSKNKKLYTDIDFNKILSNDLLKILQESLKERAFREDDLLKILEKNFDITQLEDIVQLEDIIKEQNELENLFDKLTKLTTYKNINSKEDLENYTESIKEKDSETKNYNLSLPARKKAEEYFKKLNNNATSYNETIQEVVARLQSEDSNSMLEEIKDYMEKIDKLEETFIQKYKNLENMIVNFNDEQKEKLKSFLKGDINEIDIPIENIPKFLEMLIDKEKITEENK